jgi:hypothetical protein
MLFFLCRLPQEKGQLLENVFADPKGFGIDPSGKLCCCFIAAETMLIDAVLSLCLPCCCQIALTESTVTCCDLLAGKYRYEMPGFRSGTAAVS